MRVKTLLILILILSILLTLAACKNGVSDEAEKTDGNDLSTTEVPQGNDLTAFSIGESYAADVPSSLIIVEGIESLNVYPQDRA